MRAFLGIIRQLEAWSPNLSFATKSMRCQTIKSAAFQWDEDCQKEFLKIKEIISATKFLAPFDINLPLELHTDASRLGGLAYVLLQKREGKEKAVIQCGSTSLTETQRNYSTTELELLGIVWGLQKCAFYCKGAPHISVFTDHAALVSLTDKELIKINNSRIVSMLEKIIDYNYKVYHLSGSQNKTADFLSRHTLPVQEAP